MGDEVPLVTEEQLDSLLDYVTSCKETDMMIERTIETASSPTTTTATHDASSPWTQTERKGKLDVPKIIGVMQLLHINELRFRQRGLNSIVSRLQSITGDPKTETRQGRVGM